jgi:hypothetical protein
MSASYAAGVTYDFYQCTTCRRLTTQPELVAALGQARGCRCGGLKFSPTNLPWSGWLRPRVLRFAWQRLRAEGLGALTRDRSEPRA